MYPAVKKYLTRQQGCEFAYADLPDDDVKLRVSRNHCVREIDVVAIKNPHSQDFRIHLAEGKTFAKGHSFEECLNQLDSVSGYGDYLWAFFPAKSWQQLSKTDRDLNETKLRKKGFGLFLIEDDRCDEQIPASLNLGVIAAQKNQVLIDLRLRSDSTLPVPEPLAFQEARRAETAVILCGKMRTVVETAIKEALRQRRKCRWCDLDGCFLAAVWGGKPWYSVQIEPFGHSLEDGRPVIWIWLNLEDLKKEVSVGDADFGTHVYLEYPSEGNDKTVLVQDFKSGSHGAPRNLFLGHRVELIGRTTEAIKKDLVTLLRRSRNVLRTARKK